MLAQLDSNPVFHREPVHREYGGTGVLARLAGGAPRLSMSWECQRLTTNDCSKKKAAPFLGPPFKEAERREVREDFARCRSAKQNDVSEVVENNGFW